MSDKQNFSFYVDSYVVDFFDSKASKKSEETGFGISRNQFIKYMADQLIEFENRTEADALRFLSRTVKPGLVGKLFEMGCLTRDGGVIFFEKRVEFQMIGGGCIVINRTSPYRTVIERESDAEYLLITERKGCHKGTPEEQESKRCITVSNIEEIRVEE